MIGMFKRRYKKVTEKGYICYGLGTAQDNDEYDPDTWTSKTDGPLPVRYEFAVLSISN